MTRQVSVGRWQTIAVVVLALAYAVYCLALLPPGPVTAPDSAGYLAFAPIHLLGYVSFLRVFGATGAMVAQPVLFSVALAWLGIETLRLSSSVWLAGAVVVAPMVVPELRTYHYSILTESLFMSCLVAFLAGVVAFVREPSVRRVVGVSTIASVAAIIRSPGLALLAVVPVMTLMFWRQLPGRRIVLVVAAVAPVIAIAGGERAAARVIHGDRMTSLMGRDLFAKAALIDAAPPATPSSDPEQAQLERDLDERYAPMRMLLAQASPAVQAILSLYYETCLEGPCVPQIGTTDATVAPKGVNDALARAGFARLARAPLGYIGLTAREYRSLWTAFRLRDPGTVPLLNAFIEQHRPLPFEQLVFKVGAADRIAFEPSRPVRLLQPAVIAIGWLTGVFALVGLLSAAVRRPLSPALAVTCLVSLAAHSAVLFYSLAAAGIGRYMLGLWPAVTTAVLFGAWWLITLMRDVGDARRLRHQDLHLEQFDERLGP